MISPVASKMTPLDHSFDAVTTTSPSYTPHPVYKLAEIDH